MPKFKLEVPVRAYFTVIVEADSEEEALDKTVNVPSLCLQCGPKLFMTQDGIDWEKIEVIK